MSLVIDVKINSHVIATVAAHRQGPKGATSLYTVVLYDHEKGGERTLGTITHTAGDGSLRLARKALEMADV